MSFESMGGNCVIFAEEDSKVLSLNDKKEKM
jgi:hypothetical protein